MKNEEIMALKEKIKKQDEILVEYAHELLVAKLKAHPNLKRCPNFEFLARVIAKVHHYGPNKKTGVIQAHLDAERLHPSTLTLETILARMQEDEDYAVLLRPAAPKWTPPADNPWMKRHWNMTIQGQVFKNDPELAAKWEAEAKRRDAVNA